VLLIAVGSLLVRGMNLGLGFHRRHGDRGAITRTPWKLPKVRADLGKAGFGDAQAQHFGASRDVLIRIPPRDEQRNAATLSNDVLHALQGGRGRRGRHAGASRIRRAAGGPGTGGTGGAGGAGRVAGDFDLRHVSLRMAAGGRHHRRHRPRRECFTVGWFSLFQIEFDLTVLAAVLAVIGYSVNDTVVVLDRIRENFRKRRKGSAQEIMNLSINETLSRTIMTSFVTLLSVIVMYFFGGVVMHGLLGRHDRRHRGRHLLVHLHRQRQRLVSGHQP
jgi:preprotein translocase subunit SecF